MIPEELEVEITNAYAPDLGNIKERLQEKVRDHVLDSSRPSRAAGSIVPFSTPSTTPPPAGSPRNWTRPTSICSRRRRRWCLPH